MVILGQSYELFKELHMTKAGIIRLLIGADMKLKLKDESTQKNFVSRKDAKSAKKREKKTNS